MNDWNRYDWFFTVGPFVVLALIAAWTVRRARKARL